MRGHRSVLLVVLVLLAYGVAARGSLTGADISRSVWRNSSLVFTVMVEDPGIDPLAPALHPITFSVYQAPEHGVIAGDFSQIIYMSPSLAMLVLSYTPAIGYAGPDRAILRAENPIGDSVLIRISLDVISPYTVAVLSGTFSVSTTIDVQTGSFTAAEVDGTIKYSLQATTFEVGFRLKRATPADDLFDDLWFSLRSPLGDFTTVSGKVEFDPASSNPLRLATFSTVTSIGGMTMTCSTRSDGTPDGTRLTLGLTGRTEDVLSLTATSSFSPCESLFRTAMLSVGYRGVPCGSSECLLNLDASVGFSCSGFEAITVTASGLRLPDVPHLRFSGAASVTVAYDVAGGKAVTITPSVTTSWIEGVCLRVRIKQDPSDHEVIEYQSLHLDHTFPNGVRLRMDTSLDPYDLGLNQQVTNHMDYWERDTLSGSFTYCEGIGGSWEIATYFARPGVGTTLFSWGMTELTVDVSCDAGWTLFTKVTFRSGVFGGPTCEWLLGAEIEW